MEPIELLSAKALNEDAAGTPAQYCGREGEYWTLTYDGVTCRLKDTKGLRHLAHLLQQPQRDVPALVLDARPAADPAPAAREQARVNVTRAITAALRRIAAHHPLLAAHLTAAVRTGHRCAYRPDPDAPMHWEVVE